MVLCTCQVQPHICCNSQLNIKIPSKSLLSLLQPVNCHPVSSSIYPGTIWERIRRAKEGIFMGQDTNSLINERETNNLPLTPKHYSMQKQSYLSCPSATTTLQKQPPVFLLNMTWTQEMSWEYDIFLNDMRYIFGQFGSAILPVSLPPLACGKQRRSWWCENNV